MANRELLILSLIFFATTLASACNFCHIPKPNPVPKAPPVNHFCPRDSLKFGVCADVLGLVDLVIGAKPSSKCCALLDGLADLEAAACLCTAIKANVLGIIKVEWDVALSALVSTCKKSIPDGFKCV
ncbi:hypothetical protein Sjap_019307 [Stephania japonica]|uniref:Bifunctional inhibitor/plant lipid transfer protein/seed storage helical domain-containing protein n=1 Tax=Stephania japonica TaxID=461633 RepID=A0AAP0F5R4_9MAGN